MSKTLILVNDPILYKEITSDHITYVRDAYFSHDIHVIGRGLFAIDGPEWKSRREAINPFFSKRKIEEHFNIIVESCEKMIKYALEKKTFDLRSKKKLIIFFFLKLFFSK
jgi:cytochrome P450